MGRDCHGYQKRKRSCPCQALTLLSLFFVPGVKMASLFFHIIDMMMDCWHLALKELIDILHVCKKHLKLGGEKNV